jgi:hypothetical protein
MISVRPVNRILGFGMSGMTASDVLLLPKLLMLICRDPHHQLALRVSNCCFTHSASRIDCAVVQAEMMSARENVCSAHVKLWKMTELGGAKGRKKRAPDPQISIWREQIAANSSYFYRTTGHQSRSREETHLCFESSRFEIATDLEV